MRCSACGCEMSVRRELDDGGRPKPGLLKTVCRNRKCSRYQSEELMEASAYLAREQEEAER